MQSRKRFKNKNEFDNELQNYVKFSLDNHNKDKNYTDVGTKIWENIRLGVYDSVSVIPNYSFLEAIVAPLSPNVPHSKDPVRRYTQPHGNGETCENRIATKKELFYGEAPAQPEQCLVGIVINGLLYILNGNARAEASLSAEKSGKSPVFTLVLINHNLEDKC